MSIRKLKELKQEIEEVFSAREKHRAKRLQRHDENTNNGQEGAKNTVSPRGKASKSLRFSDTTCTSFGDTDALAAPIYDDGTPLVSCLSPIQSHPYGLVLRAFQNSELNVGSSRPRLTSTPISSDHGRTRDSSQVRISVKYPSKTVNKHLSTVYQSVGKALSHGIPSQIAGAIMKCQPLQQHVTQKVLKMVSKEVTGLCSKSNPSLLRKSAKTDLEKFDLELLCNEWRVRAPVFYSFLLTTCINKRTKNSTWFGSLALAGSILLKQRNAEMSATASVMGVLLKSKSIEVCLYVSLNFFKA